MERLLPFKMAYKESEPHSEQNLKTNLESFAQKVDLFIKSPRIISSQIDEAFALSESLEKTFIQETCRFMENYGLYKSLNEKGGFKTCLNEEDLKKEPGSPTEIRMSQKFTKEDTRLKIIYGPREKYVLGHSRNKKRDSSTLYFSFGDKRGQKIEFFKWTFLSEGLESNIIKGSVYQRGKVIEENKLFIKKSDSGYSIESSFEKRNP
jgi:hypothetical protein